MPYVSDPNNPLSWLMAPLKAISAPWGAVQTGIAGGDPWQALADPDTAIRGRQFLERLGWASPLSFGCLACRFLARKFLVLIWATIAPFDTINLLDRHRSHTRGNRCCPCCHGWRRQAG